MEQGAAVTVGVRPEAVDVVEAGAAALPGRVALPARVESVERLGNITYAYLDGGTPEVITVQMMGDTTLATGQQVQLALPQNQLHIFDQSGMIAPAIGN